MFKIALTAWLAALLAAPALAQTPTGTLGRIQAAKAINVAFSPSSPPFSSVGTDGAPAGYSIDLCKRVIAQVGRTVGVPNLQVHWKAGSVSERVQMVASGAADLECANTTQTLTRLASVDFSNLIFIDGGGFLVKAGAPINQISDLGGKRIAVLKGTTTQARLADTLSRRLINATVVPIDNAADGVAMLEDGKVDAYAGDKIKLSALARLAKDPDHLALVIEDLSYEPYALALPRNDSAFRLEVNTALSQVYTSGEIGKIYEQWLGKLGRPSGLLAMMFLLNTIPH